MFKEQTLFVRHIISGIRVEMRIVLDERNNKIKNKTHDFIIEVRPRKTAEFIVRRVLYALH